MPKKVWALPLEDAVICLPYCFTLGSSSAKTKRICWICLTLIFHTCLIDTNGRYNRHSNIIAFMLHRTESSLLIKCSIVSYSVTWERQWSVTPADSIFPHQAATLYCSEVSTFCWCHDDLSEGEILVGSVKSKLLFPCSLWRWQHHMV